MYKQQVWGQQRRRTCISVVFLPLSRTTLHAGEEGSQRVPRRNQNNDNNLQATKTSLQEGRTAEHRLVNTLGSLGGTGHTPTPIATHSTRCQDEEINYITLSTQITLLGASTGRGRRREGEGREMEERGREEEGGGGGGSRLETIGLLKQIQTARKV